MQGTDNRFAVVAGEAFDQFETRFRPEGDNRGAYDTLKDGAPEWLRDLVHQAHGDFLPDDWRYECIRAVFGFIHDNDCGEDADGHEFADQHVDVYTGDRLLWLSSNLNRANYCDEAASELGWSGDVDIIRLIGMGQYMEALEVFALVVEGLRERVES